MKKAPQQNGDTRESNFLINHLRRLLGDKLHGQLYIPDHTAQSETPQQSRQVQFPAHSSDTRRLYMRLFYTGPIRLRHLQPGTASARRLRLQCASLLHDLLYKHDILRSARVEH